MGNSPDSSSGFRTREGPAFRVPWEAQVFSLICALQEAGTLPSAEWSAILGEEIRGAPERGDPDLGDTYYLHCLSALEKWLMSSNLTQSEEIAARVAEWRNAYLSTPHGQPVELR